MSDSICQLYTYLKIILKLQTPNIKIRENNIFEYASKIFFASNTSWKTRFNLLC